MRDHFVTCLLSSASPVVQDAAGVATGHHDVASLTPAASPRVADNPGRTSVANSGDGMVEVSGAGSSEDTARIGLEGTARGDNGNSHRSAIQSRDQAGIGGGDATSSTSSGSLGAASVATTITASVGVAASTADTAIARSPVEGVRRQTTTAAVVSSRAGAVNQVLLAQHRQVALADLSGALQSSDGSEGPAGTALALVANRVNSASLTPVLVVGGISNNAIIQRNQGSSVLSAELANVGVDELLVGQISEFVHAEGVGVVLGIVLLDELNVVLENVESLEELRGAFILLVEDIHELHKLVLSIDGADGKGR